MIVDNLVDSFYIMASLGALQWVKDNRERIVSYTREHATETHELMEDIMIELMSYMMLGEISFRDGKFIKLASELRSLLEPGWENE